MIQNQQHNRVKEILNKLEKFENNRIQNELRISLLHNKSKAASPTKLPNSYSFQRSATCINFTKQRHSPDKSENNNDEKSLISSDDCSEFERAASENTKRCSIIRRSPAFRMDKNSKPLISLKSKEESEIDQQVEEDENKEKERYRITQSLPPDYTKLSDTLKKALSKPLPLGPPPVKPKRTFASPVKETPPIMESKPVIASNNSVKNKIEFLNKNLKIDINQKPNAILAKSPKQEVTKSKISNIFSCIQNGTESIYDSVGDDEHIYDTLVLNKSQIKKNEKNSKSLKNCCSSSEAGDLHYMVRFLLIKFVLIMLWINDHQHNYIIE